ncbi:MAG: hypothetical protein ABJA84_06210 [Polaromonas sp.]
MFHGEEPDGKVLQLNESQVAQVPGKVKTLTASVFFCESAAIVRNQAMAVGGGVRKAWPRFMDLGASVYISRLRLTSKPYPTALSSEAAYDLLA